MKTFISVIAIGVGIIACVLIGNFIFFVKIAGMDYKNPFQKS